MKFDKTERGFAIARFEDYYGKACSLQKSSIAAPDTIWFGIDNASPIVMASEAADVGVQTDQTVGWVPYPIPEQVQLTTRMHLTRDQVRELLPVLLHFANTGELPS